MNFSNPDSLYWLILIAVPVIIHLLFFKKYKTYYFSNVSGILPTVIEKNRVKKIKHWIILSLRTLAMAAIILAFALPYLSRTESNEKYFVYWMDNSSSMAESEKGVSLLDKSKSKSIQSLDQIPSDARIKVISPDAPFLDLPWLSKGEAKAKIESIKRGQHFFDFSKYKATIQDLSKKGAQSFLLSDLQKHDAYSDLDKEQNWNVINLRETKASGNNWIADVTTSVPLVMSNVSSTFNVLVERNEIENEGSTIVHLRSPKNQLNLSSEINWTAGVQSTLISFNTKTGADSIQEFSISIQDNDLQFDNQFPFLVFCDRVVGIDVPPPSKSPLTAFVERFPWIKLDSDSTETRVGFFEGVGDYSNRINLYSGSGLILGKNALKESGLAQSDSTLFGLSINLDLPFFTGLFVSEIDNPDLPNAKSGVLPNTDNWNILFQFSNGYPGAMYQVVNGKKVIWFNADFSDKLFFNHPITKLILFRFFELSGGSAVLSGKELDKYYTNNTGFSKLNETSYIPLEESALGYWDEDSFMEQNPALPLLNSQEFMDGSGSINQGSSIYKILLILGLLFLVLEAIFIRKEQNI
ncbi:MAG: hypothetical protein ACI9YL_000247 [Luteibaculaceae bacterium]|jgi:hypothetical protein